MTPRTNDTDKSDKMREAERLLRELLVASEKFHGHYPRFPHHRLGVSSARAALLAHIRTMEAPAVPQGAQGLREAILALPCKPYDGTDAYTHYCRGFSEACSAAASLASAPPAVPQTYTRAEVLSDVAPVALEVWKLQGRKVGAMLKEAQDAVIEAQEALDDAKESAIAPETLLRLSKFLDVAAGAGYEFDGVDAADLYCEIFDGEPTAAPAVPAEPTGAWNFTDWWRLHGRFNAEKDDPRDLVRRKELMQLAFEVAREGAVAIQTAEGEVAKP